MRLFFSIAIVLMTMHPGWAQVSTSPIKGLRKNTPRLHVLRGADAWISPDKKIANAVIVLRNGVIESAGDADTKVPDNARVWNLEGKTIYSGFVETAAILGEPVSPNKNSTHWNPLVRPERRSVEFKTAKKEEIDTLRKLGFTTAHVLPEKGIFRGQSSLLNLSEEPSVLKADVRQYIGFELAKEGYPRSLMGSIALIRQTLHNAIWYRNNRAYIRDHPDAERAEENRALDALGPVIEKKQALLIQAGDELDYARIFALADEFDLPGTAILGNGYEYRQLDLLEKSKSTVIVPLEFPKAPPVENPESALELSLETLEHWERAPSNPAILATRNIPICLSTHGMEKASEHFWKHVREAVNQGLAPKAALASLTSTAASMLGISDQAGTIEAGKLANLVIASGDLFQEEDAEIQAVWIDGRRHEMAAARKVDFRGSWTLEWDGIKAEEPWMVSGKVDSPKVKAGEEELPVKVEGKKVLIYPPAELLSSDLEGTARLTGRIQINEKTVLGTAYLPDGKSLPWKATIGEADSEGEDADKEKEDPNKEEKLPPYLKYPAGAFGLEKIPAQPDAVLVRKATIWTSGPDGRLQDADLLVRKGKIVAVGKNLPAPRENNVVIIDASGKHVTAGLIDCHSHSAMSRGINEGSDSVTVEVRVADIVNPTDIALYRELAGGLTTANILHGSANPMGGQNQVIKLRWGSRQASDMYFSGAKPGVKFALGENVKQSNWDKKTDRYPQTRMGVEQIMKDTFLAAREYKTQQAQARKRGEPHRRDLRLEAALEILERKRIVHIHSYRQDEILMFVRLAQEFDIEVGTFQHVLEGYKIADAIAEIGAGGSTFSDWWAYKFEVYDAIPYNGSLMHRAGVITSFNSDSNELATRLNTEAAKAVKYGGLSEEEAMKFVTLNPARQLRIDHRVGSLEKGKDADFVIWSASPLSGYTRAEQTWIDGRRYFSIEADQQLQTEALAERERLIAKALPKRIKAIEKSKAKKELEEEDVKQKTEKGKPSHLGHGHIINTGQVLRKLYHNGRDVHNGNDCNTCSRKEP